MGRKQESLNRRVYRLGVAGVCDEEALKRVGEDGEGNRLV
jgi:hypothetical protein